MKYNLKNEILTLYLEGDLNSSNSEDVGEEIEEITSNKEFNKIVFDLENLRYISSAGLRTILRVKQQHDDVSLINASLEVYDVFQMTGFTSIMNV